MPVRCRSPHSITITASPGSSTRSVTSMSGTPGKASSGAGGASRLTTRTSLPRCRRANAMAIDDPMASPSGRACEVTTKRCRVRTSSTMRARAVSVAVWIIDRGWGRLRRSAGVVLPGAARVLRVEIAQDLLDAVLVLDRLVELEVELGDAPQLQPAADLAAEEWRGTLEGARRVLARLLVAQRGVVDARRLQVGGDLDAREGDEA